MLSTVHCVKYIDIHQHAHPFRMHHIKSERNIFESKTEVQKMWVGPDSRGWEVQRMIHVIWNWRDISEVQVKETSGNLWQRRPVFLEAIGKGINKYFYIYNFIGVNVSTRIFICLFIYLSEETNRAVAGRHLDFLKSYGFYFQKASRTHPVDLFSDCARTWNAEVQKALAIEWCIWIEQCLRCRHRCVSLRVS